MKPETALLTAQEAMAILKVGRAFLTHHAAEMGATKIGRLWRISPENLEAYKARNRITGPAVQPAPTPIRKPALASPRVMNPVTGRPFESMAR